MTFEKYDPPYYAGSLCDPEYIAISSTVQGTGRHRDFVDMEIIKGTLSLDKNF